MSLQDANALASDVWIGTRGARLVGFNILFGDETWLQEAIPNPQTTPKRYPKDHYSHPQIDGKVNPYFNWRWFMVIYFSIYLGITLQLDAEESKTWLVLGLYHTIFVLSSCYVVSSMQLSRPSKHYRDLAIFVLSFHWPWIPKTANFFTAAGLDRDNPKDSDWTVLQLGNNYFATQTLLVLVHSHTSLPSLFCIFLDWWNWWKWGKKWTSLYTSKAKLKVAGCCLWFLLFPQFNPMPPKYVGQNYSEPQVKSQFWARCSILAGSGWNLGFAEAWWSLQTRHLSDFLAPGRRQDGGRNGAIAPAHDVVRVDSWRCRVVSGPPNGGFRK